MLTKGISTIISLRHSHTHGLGIPLCHPRTIEWSFMVPKTSDVWLYS